jgi:hypothetical protein
MQNARRQIVAIAGILALLLHVAATVGSPGSGASGIVRVGGEQHPDRLCTGNDTVRPPLALPEPGARAESLAERPTEPHRSPLTRTSAARLREQRAVARAMRHPPLSCMGRRWVTARPHLRIGPPDSDDPHQLELG